MTPLDKEDVRQLRRADTIVFRHDARDGGFSRIEGTIGPSPAQRHRGMTGEMHFELPVAPTTVANYGPDRIVAGCWVFSSAHYNPELATALSLPLVGCVLTPSYEADAHRRHEGEQDAYVVDTFALRVRKPDGKLLTFNLGYQITPRIGNASLIRNLYTEERARRIMGAA